MNELSLPVVLSITTLLATDPGPVIIIDLLGSVNADFKKTRTLTPVKVYDYGSTP